jgi:hypothetical protein
VYNTRQAFGYSLFDDIDDRGLQARNRAVVMKNLSADRGDDDVKEYFSMIPEAERLPVIGQLAILAGVK